MIRQLNRGKIAARRLEKAVDDVNKAAKGLVKLTNREAQLIRSAFRIATEDGSIYGGAETDEERAKVDQEIEAIEDKLDL